MTGQGAAGCGSVDPRRVARDVRHAPRARGVACARGVRRAQAGRAAPASGRLAGGDPPEEVRDDGSGPERVLGSRPREPRLHGAGTGPTLGGRHHRHRDAGGVPVPRGRARCVESARRGVGHGDASPQGDRDPRARHGGSATTATRRHSPVRPRRAVPVDRLRRTMPPGRRAPVDGLRGRLLRQRDVRELLRRARVRAAGPQALRLLRRGPGGGLLLYRGLLQHAPPPLLPRLPLARRLRGTVRRSSEGRCRSRGPRLPGRRGSGPSRTASQPPPPWDDVPARPPRTSDRCVDSVSRAA